MPTVWDVHTPTFLYRRDQRFVLHRMIRASAFRALTTNCDALRRAILAAIPEVGDRIVTAHGGADPIADDVIPIDLGAADRLRVGYVGQLYAGKGFELIRRIAEEASWADFYVVGGNQEAIEAIQRDPDLPGNIRLCGFVPPAETGRFLLAFDVLLAPYQAEVRTAGGGETGSWMSPLKLFEYMAAAKPIVCSVLPVLHEIVKDGHNGLLVAHDNAQAWATVLRRLCKS